MEGWRYGSGGVCWVLSEIKGWEGKKGGGNDRTRGGEK